MTSFTSKTRKEAQDHLKAKGMKQTAPSKRGRAYWGFGGGRDRFFDHSATITNIGKDGFSVADFSK